MNIGALTATLGVDTGGLDRAAQRMKQFENTTNRSMDAVAAKMKRVGDKFTAFGKKASLYATAPILAAASASFKMASDLEENINKTDVAFKENANNVKQWSKSTLTAFGLSQSSALEMVSLFGDMSTSMGLTTGKAAEMSKRLVGLAGDLASFKNINIEQAQNALSGVFTGESQSLKKLGIVMTETTLQEYAYAQGITQKIDKMSQAEKVMLRYNYVLSTTKNAQGDFQRTSEGAANQMRIFMESIKETAASFGQILLPVITPIIKRVNEVIQVIGRLTTTQKEWIFKITAAVAAIGPLSMIIGFLSSTVIPSFVFIVGIATKAMSLLSLAFAANPIGVFVVAILAAGAAIYALNANMNKLTATQETANTIARKAKNSIVEEQIEIRKLVEQVKNDTESKENKIEALRKLNAISPAYLGVIDEDAIKTGKASSAIDLYIKTLEKKARVQAAEEMFIRLEKERIDLLMDASTKQKTFGGALLDTFLSGGNAVLGATRATTQFAKSISDITEKQKYLKSVMEGTDGFTIDYQEQAKGIKDVMTNVSKMNIEQVDAVRARIQEQISLEKQHRDSLLGEHKKLMEGKASILSYERQKEIDLELTKNATNLANYSKYIASLNVIARKRTSPQTGGDGGTGAASSMTALGSSISLIETAVMSTTKQAELLRKAFGKVAGALDTASITSQLGFIAQQASILGDSFDSNGAQLSIWTSEWKRLWDEGLRPGQAAFDYAQNQVQKLTYAVNTNKGSFDEASQSAQNNSRMMADFGSIMNSVGSMTDDSTAAWLNYAQGVLSASSQLVQVLLEIFTKKAAVLAIDTAMTAQQNINTAAVATNTVMKGANAAASGVAAAASGGEAIAGATASGAKMPFPLNLIAIAAGVAAVIAALTSTSNKSKDIPRMAKGGIIPAGYPNDSFPAMLQSGEAVIPLEKLGGIIGNSKIEQKPQKVIFQIKGRTLEAVNNEQMKYRRAY